MVAAAAPWPAAQTAAAQLNAPREACSGTCGWAVVLHAALGLWKIVEPGGCTPFRSHSNSNTPTHPARGCRAKRPWELLDRTVGLGRAVRGRVGLLVSAGQSRCALRTVCTMWHVARCVRATEFFVVHCLWPGWRQHVPSGQWACATAFAFLCGSRRFHGADCRLAGASTAFSRR